MSAIEPVYLELARWMKQQREKYGISQSQLSLLLGFSRPTCHLIEEGKQRVYLHTYEKLRVLLDDDKIDETKALLAAHTGQAPPPDQPIETPPKGNIEWNAVEVGARIKPEYEAGATLADLATKYGFPRRHIIYALTVAGVNVRQFQMPPKANLQRDGEIVRLYDGGKGRTCQEIGLAYGISAERVRQILDRAGIPRVPPPPRPKIPLTDDQRKALADLAAGMTHDEIHAKYGYSERVLARLKKKAQDV